MVYLGEKDEQRGSALALQLAWPYCVVSLQDRAPPISVQLGFEGQFISSHSLVYEDGMAWQFGTRVSAKHWAMMSYQMNNLTDESLFITKGGGSQFGSIHIVIISAY